MSKLAKRIYLPSNAILDVEDTVAESLLPMLKEALYPGVSVSPKRNVVIVIEVLPL